MHSVTLAFNRCQGIKNYSSLRIYQVNPRGGKTILPIKTLWAYLTIIISFELNICSWRYKIVHRQVTWWYVLWRAEVNVEVSGDF